MTLHWYKILESFTTALKYNVALLLGSLNYWFMLLKLSLTSLSSYWQVVESFTSNFKVSQVVEKSHKLMPSFISRWKVSSYLQVSQVVKKSHKLMPSFISRWKPYKLFPTLASFSQVNAKSHKSLPSLSSHC